MVKGTETRYGGEIKVWFDPECQKCGDDADGIAFKDEGAMKDGIAFCEDDKPEDVDHWKELEEA